MTLNNHDLNPIRQGNTFPGEIFTFQNPLDYILTGATITMQVKTQQGRLRLQLGTIDETIEIVDPVTFKINPITVNIEPEVYQYDILIQYLDGRNKTFVGGKWEVEQAVTIVPIVTNN